MIGGFVAQYQGWRWTQWCILFASVPIYLVSIPMKETYKKPILQARAKRLGIEPPKQTGPTGKAKIKLLLTVTLFRPVHMLVSEPIVILFSLYSAFTFALLFAFFASFPVVFTEVYHFSVSQNGMVFLGVAIGVLLAWLSAVLIDKYIYQKKHKLILSQGKQNVSPEHRLYAAMMGSVGLTISLFWFAWTARPSVHWIVPILATIPFAWGNLIIFVSLSRRQSSMN